MSCRVGKGRKHHKQWGFHLGDDRMPPSVPAGSYWQVCRFALSGLSTGKELAGCVSSLEGVEGDEGWGFKSKSDKMSWSRKQTFLLNRKQKFIWWKKKRKIVLGQLRLTFCPFRYQIQNTIICTVLTSAAILSCAIHAQFIWLALLWSLQYHETHKATGKALYSLPSRATSDALSQKEQHWQDQDKIHSLLRRIYLLLHQKMTGK